MNFLHSILVFGCILCSAAYNDGKFNHFARNFIARDYTRKIDYTMLVINRSSR